MSPKRQILINSAHCTGCLNCQLICSLTFQRKFNPAAAYISVAPATGGSKAINEVTLTDRCNHCGVCVGYCVYGTLSFGREG